MQCTPKPLCLLHMTAWSKRALYDILRCTVARCPEAHACNLLGRKRLYFAGERWHRQIALRSEYSCSPRQARVACHVLNVHINILAYLASSASAFMLRRFSRCARCLAISVPHFLHRRTTAPARCVRYTKACSLVYKLRYSLIRHFQSGDKPGAEHRHNHAACWPTLYLTYCILWPRLAKCFPVLLIHRCDAGLPSHASSTAAVPRELPDMAQTVMYKSKYVQKSPQAMAKSDCSAYI